MLTDSDYEIFSEVNDPELRARNRAICMYNIQQDPSHSHSGGTRTNREGLTQMMNYLQRIPERERAPVVAKLALLLEGGGTA